MGEVEVLIKFPGREDAARLVRVTTSSGEKVAALKENILRKEGIQPIQGCEISLTFNGVELMDGLTLEQCGLLSATGAERWAGDYVYPNGWHLMAHRKPTLKATDPYWPPKRQHSSPGILGPLFVPRLLRTVITPTSLLVFCVIVAILMAPLA